MFVTVFNGVFKACIVKKVIVQLSIKAFLCKYNIVNNRKIRFKPGSYGLEFTRFKSNYPASLRRKLLKK